MYILKADIFQEIIDKVEQSLKSLGNFPIILYQFLALIVLFLVVKFFFWNKITKFLDKQRYDEIMKNKEAERKEMEANIKLEKVNKQFLEMKQETEVLRKQLIKEAQDAKEKIIKEAKEQAKQRLEHLELELQEEINSQEELIKSQIKEIAYEAAEKILKRELRSKEYDDLINDITKEISFKKHDHKI